VRVGVNWVVGGCVGLRGTHVQLLQEGHQFHELHVVAVVEPALNRDSVVQLVPAYTTSRHVTSHTIIYTAAHRGAQVGGHERQA
jgi:hypothetical protein